MDLFRRAFGALPDAAWLRRQFTADAEVVHDLRHGVRMLRKSPTFTRRLSSRWRWASAGQSRSRRSSIRFSSGPSVPDAERIVTLWQRPPPGSAKTSRRPIFSTGGSAAAPSSRSRRRSRIRTTTPAVGSRRCSSGRRSPKDSGMPRRDTGAWPMVPAGGARRGGQPVAIITDSCGSDASAAIPGS